MKVRTDCDARGDEEGHSRSTSLRWNASLRWEVTAWTFILPVDPDQALVDSFCLSGDAS
jgi:hypothetical protein